jgi:hypothetical protein
VLELQCRVTRVLLRKEWTKNEAAFAALLIFAAIKGAQSLRTITCYSGEDSALTLPRNTQNPHVL